MAKTRSKTKQTQLEDVPGVELKHDTKSDKAAPKDKVANSKASSHPGQSPDKIGRSTKKRPLSPTAPVQPRAKEPRARPPPSDTKKPKGEDTEASKNAIIINRAPVLQLWSATVAQATHRDLSWSTCLSIGAAISALCAVSKGRAIGMIEPPSDQDGESKSKEKKTAAQRRTVSVMSFTLPIKDELAVIGGKPKPANEGALESKFGREEYRVAKQAFQEAVQSWKDDEAALDKKAFGLYEKFRPNVASGQKGWGRKGALDLGKVKEIITGVGKDQLTVKESVD